MSLSRDVESKLAEDYEFIIGIDEAGRGPLAGPVVAAACWIRKDAVINGRIVDSKITSETERDIAYDNLTNSTDVIWGVGIVSHTIIDEINILQATMQAMKDAAAAVLNAKNVLFTSSKCIGLVDGNRIPENMPFHSKFVIKGDSNVFIIAAASIIAKVTRDRIMHKLDQQYPQYGLAQHKGYPTLQHRAALMEHGPSPIHRLSYGPVRLAAAKHGLSVPELPPTKNPRKIVTGTAPAPDNNKPAVSHGIKKNKKTISCKPVLEATITPVTSLSKKAGGSKRAMDKVQSEQEPVRRSPRLSINS